MKVKNRRRIINYSIKRDMQIRLLGRIAAIVFIAVGATSLIFYFFSNQEVGSTYRQFHINMRNFMELLLPVVVAAFVSGIILAGSVAVFFPHSIAGPLHRIEKELKERVGEGDLTVRFSVRKGDEVGELSDTLNVMMERFRLKVERVKMATEELSSLLKRHEDGHRFKDAVGHLEDAVKEFKL